MLWSDKARNAIAKAHASIDDAAPLADRIKAIDAAYPFGIRQHFPYKVWLRERAAYLKRYGYKRKIASVESPLEREIRRSNEGAL